MTAAVYLVHCIDTEGPLAEEPLSFGARHLGRSAVVENFDAELPDTIARHRARVLGTWESIFEMLEEAMAPEFRNRMTDASGGGWIYNWFCMDHVGFMENPRQRAMGIHNVLDVYKRITTEQNLGDGLHWHFHPTSTYGQGHRCATSYMNSPQLWDILSRRLIDRGCFPVANRAGFQDQRPDSHWFLEQWVPFDFSNIATDDSDAVANADLADGRFNDWRWAADDWSTYQPHHDCYQKPGACRRKIARCLNLLSRFGNLTEAELEKAFRRAAEGKPTLVSFSSHDWRDLRTEVNYVRHLLKRVSQRFPQVPFKFCEATEAFNAVHPAEKAQAVDLDAWLIFDERGLPSRVEIATAAGKVFGPQPFFAVRTRSRRYIHDNLNYGTSPDSFYYAFDEHSILPEDVAAIGLAANDALGNQSLHVIELDAAQLRPGTRVKLPKA